MTYEEALKAIESLIRCAQCAQTDYVYGVDGVLLDVCKEALEKQIPKKPFHTHKNYYCPTCKEGGWMMWDDAVPVEMDSYCGICGQAIDWSEKE